MSELEEAINKMMEVAGFMARFEHLQQIPEWFSKYTWTEKEEAEFRKWFVKKHGKISWPYFNLQYGLRIKE